MYMYIIRTVCIRSPYNMPCVATNMVPGGAMGGLDTTMVGLGATANTCEMGAI